MRKKRTPHERELVRQAISAAVNTLPARTLRTLAGALDRPTAVGKARPKPWTLHRSDTEEYGYDDEWNDTPGKC